MALPGWRNYRLLTTPFLPYTVIIIDTVIGQIDRVNVSSHSFIHSGPH